MRYASPGWTLGVAFCAVAATAAAQQTTAGSQSRSATAGRIIVIGCIERSNASGSDRAGVATYTITDRRGEKPSTYRLEGDAAQLDLHVGHTVEAAGTITKGSSSDKSDADVLTLKAGPLIWISSRCSK